MANARSFIPSFRQHGGSFREGKRKLQRPFDPKRPLHVTFRSSKARGPRSLLRRKWEISKLAQFLGEKYDVRIYRFANVGNHLHLLIQTRKRLNLQAFLREFAGSVAVLVTKAIKGRPEKFWDRLAWSKIVDWGRHFEDTSRYVIMNLLESVGARSRLLANRLERDGLVIIGPD